eukprot:gene7241-biopygen10556
MWRCSSFGVEWVGNRVPQKKPVYGSYTRSLCDCLLLGETSVPASGPLPVRVRFFDFYRAARVRSASAAVAPPLNSSPLRGPGEWCQETM